MRSNSSLARFSPYPVVHEIHQSPYRFLLPPPPKIRLSQTKLICYWRILEIKIFFCIIYMWRSVKDYVKLMKRLNKFDKSFPDPLCK